MFIQKVFHVRRGLEETKALLTKVHLYRRQLDGVKTAVLTADGVGQFDCELPGGFRAHCVLVELPTNDSNQTLFQSTAGNLEISGLVEFISIRDNLTEVQMTLECTFKSTVYSILEAATNGVEQFLNRQLCRVESWLDSNATFLPAESGTQFAAHLPQFAR